MRNDIDVDGRESKCCSEESYSECGRASEKLNQFLFMFLFLGRHKEFVILRTVTNDLKSSVNNCKIR